MAVATATWGVPAGQFASPPLLTSPDAPTSRDVAWTVDHGRSRCSVLLRRAITCALFAAVAWLVSALGGMATQARAAGPQPDALLRPVVGDAPDFPSGASNPRPVSPSRSGPAGPVGLVPAALRAAPSIGAPAVATLAPPLSPGPPMPAAFLPTAAARPLLDEVGRVTGAVAGADLLSSAAGVLGTVLAD